MNVLTIEIFILHFRGCEKQQERNDNYCLWKKGEGITNF